MVNLTDPQTLVVVITGCDSGFGAEITQRFFELGSYTIYATCLTQEGANKLNDLKSPRLRASVVDVTNQDDIDRLQASIESECPQGVYCVLNNAGIASGIFFDFASVATYQKLMDVNFLGVVRIIKALLPSVRTYARARHTDPRKKTQPRARLLTITSIAARTNFPGLAAYSASKHAVESFLDTIRVELTPWEIDVSMFEPWYARTPMVTSALSIFDRIFHAASPKVKQMYGERFIDGVKASGREMYASSMPSEWVVDSVVQVIQQTKGSPKTRYLIGHWWVHLMVRAGEWLPGWAYWMHLRNMKRGGTWPADPFLLKCDEIQ
ncbi:hypothetical protein BGW42_000744 [Actinomortierella wolfii]|nr:hypothetical protein BGW42_000744 [Actinomortierella wolfii]